MTDTELISSLINQPLLLKKEPPFRLNELSKKFPYFFPIQYLRAAKGFNYQDAPLKLLGALFPVNPVLLFQLFHPKNQESSFQKREPLFPDQELKIAASQQDYFSGQGIKVSSVLPQMQENINPVATSKETDLMVVMSFSEWLHYLEEHTRKAKEEEADKSALRAMWQKQRLSAAIEEESEEIPENVFQMAVNSITPKDEIVSEAMAAVYVLQDKREKALEVYKKLSLQNPEKSAYFAEKIEDLQKDSDI